MMAFMGVRISWLMLARKVLLRRGSLLGPVFGGAQFLLHGPALGDVGGELDLHRLALRIKMGL